MSPLSRSETADGCALSPEEERLAEPPYLRVHRIEDFLYFQLSIARDVRLRMERLDPWSRKYLFDKIERDGALEAARGHLDALRARNHPLPRDLEMMASAEGVL